METIQLTEHVSDFLDPGLARALGQLYITTHNNSCLLYTSDAADE